MSVEFVKTVDFPTKSKTDDVENHYLEGIVASRHHAFSTYNKYNKIIADKTLDERFRCGDIDAAQCMGLDVELRFFHAFKDKLHLVPALDCGDNTDFVGLVKGKLVRFDVTKNVDYKRKFWEKYLKYKYHVVAVWDCESNTWSYYVADKIQRNLVEVKKHTKISKR